MCVCVCVRTCVCVCVHVCVCVAMSAVPCWALPGRGALITLISMEGTGDYPSLSVTHTLTHTEWHGGPFRCYGARNPAELHPLVAMASGELMGAMVQLLMC